jgi:hypothetical protein
MRLSNATFEKLFEHYCERVEGNLKKKSQNFCARSEFKFVLFTLQRICKEVLTNVSLLEVTNDLISE